MMEILFRRKFWDNKILAWETKRYTFNGLQLSALEKRVLFAKEFIESASPHKTVVDIGCGSGLLLSKLNRNAFDKFIGVDFSKIAIQFAQKQFVDFSNVDFICGEIKDVPWSESDTVVALGLTDWLTDEEMADLLSNLKNKNFLISFSNRQSWFFRFFHRVFVFCTYGWRNPKYMPRYYSMSEVELLAKRAGLTEFEFYQEPGGGLVSYLLKKVDRNYKW